MIKRVSQLAGGRERERASGTGSETKSLSLHGVFRKGLDQHNAATQKHRVPESGAPTLKAFLHMHAI